MRRTITFMLFVLVNGIGFGQFVSTQGPLKYDNSQTVYADDDVVLVTGGQQLYRSSDQGQSFHTVDFGNVDIDVRCITRVNNTLIIGAIHGEKIYRSTDLGVTWQPANTGMPTMGGVPVPVPQVSLTVGGRVFMGGTNFFRYSDDEGLTWQSSTFDGLTTGLSYTGGEVWMHSSNGGTRYSTDNGNTWNSPATNPFNAFTTNGYARTSQALVAVSDASAGMGVSRSLDNGQTWNTVSGQLSFVKCMVQVGDTLYTTSYNGLRRSVDHGLTWQPVGTFAYDVVSAYHSNLYVHNNNLWVGTSSGPVKVNMGDDSYQLYATPGAKVKQMVLAGNQLFASSESALYKWSPTASFWEDISQNLNLTGFFVEHITANGDTLYVITFSNNTTTLFQSYDGGNTFMPVTTDPSGGALTSFLTFNPMFIATLTSFKPGIRKSIDGGVTWSSSTILDSQNQPITDNGTISHLEQAGGTLFAWLNRGFMYSTDNGDTWTWNFHSGPGAGTGWPGRMISLTGETWFNDWEIRESTDGGSTWSVLNNGLPTPSGTTSVLNNRLFRLGSRIYVQIVEPGPEQYRFYYLEPQSTAWMVDPALDGLSDKAMALSGIGQQVFASLESGGVYVAAGQSGVPQTQFAKHHLEIWPNPASEMVVVMMPDELMHPGLATISVFDLQGRQVAKQPATRETSVVQLGYLPAGVYLVQLSAPNGTASARLMVR
jgi:hypothetical protein